MPANPRRLISCDAETWARFLDWGRAHGVKGYRNRVTVAATLRAMLAALEKPKR
jgi:hypothetical protein